MFGVCVGSSRGLWCIDSPGGCEAGTPVFRAQLPWLHLVGRHVHAVEDDCHPALLCPPLPSPTRQVSPADYIKPSFVPNFRAAWDALPEDSEMVDDYGIGQRDSLQVGVVECRPWAGGGGCA